MSEFQFSNLCAYLAKNADRANNNWKPLRKIKFELPGIEVLAKLDASIGAIHPVISRAEVAQSLLRDVAPIVLLRYSKLDHDILIKVLYLISINLLMDKALPTYLSKTRAHADSFKNLVLVGDPDNPVGKVIAAHDLLKSVILKSPLLAGDNYAGLQVRLREITPLVGQLSYDLFAFRLETTELLQVGKAWLPKFWVALGSVFVNGMIDALIADIEGAVGEIDIVTIKSLKKDITRAKIPAFLEGLFKSN